MRKAALALVSVAAAVLAVVAWRAWQVDLPRVGPRVEQLCVETMQQRPPDLSWVSSSREARVGGSPIPTVTLGELRSLHGSVARVAGVLHVEFEHVALYPSRAAMEDQPWQAPRVGLYTLWPDEPYVESQGPLVSDRCVLVEGRYASGPSEVGGFPGALREVYRLDVWSTPHRPLVRASPAPPSPPLDLPCAEAATPPKTIGGDDAHRAMFAALRTLYASGEFEIGACVAHVEVNEEGGVDAVRVVPAARVGPACRHTRHRRAAGRPVPRGERVWTSRPLPSDRLLRALSRASRAVTTQRRCPGRRSCHGRCRGVQRGRAMRNTLLGPSVSSAAAMGRGATGTAHSVHTRWRAVGMRLRIRWLSSLILACGVLVSCEEVERRPSRLPEPDSPARKGTATYGRELAPDQESWVIQEHPALSSDALLESPAVLVLAGTDVTPVAVRTGTRIVTWQELEVVRELRATWAAPCEAPQVPQDIRPGLRRGAKRVAVRLPGGSLSGDDGATRQVDLGPAGAIRFQTGRRYLAFGELCAGVLELGHGPDALFGVGADDVITSEASNSPESAGRERILAFGTVERLAGALRGREPR